MTIKQILGVICVYTSIITYANLAEAALIDRGGGFIYDDALDVTWTQNANINGIATWDNQVAWADSLSLYDSVRDVTWDDWRLASMDVNGDGTVLTACTNEAACRDNELLYNFVYNRVIFSAPGPFTSLQEWYWSGTEHATVLSDAWGFGSNAGWVGVDAKNTIGSNFYYAWAVRDGDVATVVPVPAAAWLFGSGLIGLIGVARRKARA